jgi:cytidine deaminase
MRVDQRLVQAALDFLENRFPGEKNRGCAAMYTDTGRILLSTYFESLNESACLCHETGAICEAYKLNEKVTATLCIDSADGAIPIFLPPCAICQERLAYWGRDISVAVPKKNDPTEYEIVTLADVQPHYWGNVVA